MNKTKSTDTHVSTSILQIINNERLEWRIQRDNTLLDEAISAAVLKENNWYTLKTMKTNEPVVARVVKDKKVVVNLRDVELLILQLRSRLRWLV